MKLIRRASQMRSFSSKVKTKRSIGFVPTMGYLHEGHAALIRKARKECNFVVVSIFVNPAQFGPKEDFKQYPRDLKRDMAVCRKAGADCVFAPAVKDIYPDGFQTYVEPGPLAAGLCGKSRPGHFRGVATVVLRLFNLVRPDRAYFGQKDFQQLRIIEQMVKDLGLPVKIVRVSTVREKDGLAMSSRNTYLDAAARVKALALRHALDKVREEIREGARNARYLKAVMRQVLKREGVRVDYAEIVGETNLSPVRRVSGKILIALAAFVSTGKSGRPVRLIDNALLNVPGK